MLRERIRWLLHYYLHVLPCKNTYLFILHLNEEKNIFSSQSRDNISNKVFHNCICPVHWLREPSTYVVCANLCCAKIELFSTSSGKNKEDFSTATLLLYVTKDTTSSKAHLAACCHQSVIIQTR